MTTTTVPSSVSVQGVSVDTQGNVSVDGLVTRVMGILDSNAPAAVKALVNGAAIVAAEVGAAETAFAGLVAALPATLAASVATLGPFVPVAGLAFGVAAALLAVDGASAGAGCCGDAPLTKAQAQAAYNFEHSFGQVTGGASVEQLMRFGTCDPSKYAWDGEYSPWGSYVPAAPGTGERFVEDFVRAAYEAQTDCWHFMPPAAYAVALAAAVGAWNRAHPSEPLSLSAHVNLTRQSTFAGHATATAGEPEDNSPISVALNFAAMKYNAKGQSAGFLAKPGALATIRTPAPKAPAIPVAAFGGRILPLGIPTAAAKATAPATKATVSGSSLAGIALFAAFAVGALVLRRRG